MPTIKTPTTAPNVLNATAAPRPVDVYNTIYKKAGEGYRESVPALTGKDASLNFKEVGQSILNGSPSVRNAFLTNLFEQFVYGRAMALIFHTPYAPLKTGVVGQGAGVLTTTWADVIKPTAYNHNPYTDSGKPKLFEKHPPKIDVQYMPANVNIQFALTLYYHELESALSSWDGSGINWLIDLIVSRVQVSAEYTDHALFTYLIGRAILSGDIGLLPVDASDQDAIGLTLRTVETDFTLPTRKYNRSGVLNSAPADNVYVLQTPQGRAKYDRNLANIFHTELAANSSKKIVVSKFSDIDWDLLTELWEDANMIVPFTEDEIDFLDETVVAVVVDKDWFEVYTKPDIQGDFQNGQQHSVTTYRTIRGYYHTSTFANGVVVVDVSKLTDTPDTLDYKVTGVELNENGSVGVTITPNIEEGVFFPTRAAWIQTEDATTDGIGVFDGGLVFPADQSSVVATLNVAGKVYTATVANTAKPGDDVLFTKEGAVPDPDPNPEG